MRNALISTGVTFAMVWLATSGQVRGWLLLLVLTVGMFWALSSSAARRGQPAAKAARAAKGTTGSAAVVPWPVRAARWAGRLWRGTRAVGRAGRAGAAAGAIPARRAWDLRRLWWRHGPGHRDLALRCRYCRHRSHTADEALAHADTHPHDYINEMSRGANGWTRTPPDVPPPADPPHDNTAPVPEPAENTEEPDMPPPALNPLGTAGRAGLAGLVVDWESSVEAREHWETFVAWLQAQAAGATHASVIVPDLVTQFHGRGPSGHAGVPDEIIDRFITGFVEARVAEANAYKRFAADYAAYVDTAETLLNQTYGREVLAQAHAAHH